MPLGEPLREPTVTLSPSLDEHNLPTNSP
jgi:hypothetical protein